MEREQDWPVELRKIVGDRASNALLQRCCYSQDASSLKGLPDWVARPLSVIEVSRILRLCHQHGIPVTPRGAGTGLAGGAVPVEGGIVLDMSGMNRILEIDIPNLQVIVEPGVIHEKLNLALKRYGFFFPPDPGSSKMCTIGGMISNNSSGMRSVKYGTTRNYVLDLEVVLANGRIIRTGSRTLKSSAGYDLTRLMVGSEGTLGIITRAGLKIAPLPRARQLLIALFEDARAAGSAVTKVFASGITPSACEILDRTSLQVLNRVDAGLALPDAGDIILFEADGSEASAKESIRQIAEVCRPTALELKVASGQEEMDSIWAARRLVGAAVSRLDPSRSRVYMGEDVGVPLRQIPELIKRVERISQESGIPAMKYGHIGDGNLHVALFIDVMDQEQWERLQGAADQIHKAAMELGGTVSSEHGIGLARAQYMEEQLGEALMFMKAIKKALDPKGILNPGKMAL